MRTGQALSAPLRSREPCTRAGAGALLGLLAGLSGVSELRFMWDTGEREPHPACGLALVTVKTRRLRTGFPMRFPIITHQSRVKHWWSLTCVFEDPVCAKSPHRTI